MAETMAIIGQATFVRGTLRGEGDLNIAGRVEGSIEVDGDICLEETALVKADVSGRSVVIRGAIVGNILAADAIAIEAGAKVVGDLGAPRITIEDGASFRGRIEMDASASRTIEHAVARAEPKTQPAARPVETQQRVGRGAPTVSSPSRAVAAPAPQARITAPTRRVQAADPVVSSPAPVASPPAVAAPMPRATAARAPIARTVAVESVEAPTPPAAPRAAASRVVAVDAEPDDPTNHNNAPPPPVVPTLKRRAKGNIRRRGAGQ